jgi:hypothetical protein
MVVKRGGRVKVFKSVDSAQLEACSDTGLTSKSPIHLFHLSRADQVGITMIMAQQDQRLSGRLTIILMMGRIMIVRRKTMIGRRIRRRFWRLLLVLWASRLIWVEQFGGWVKEVGLSVVMNYGL